MCRTDVHYKEQHHYQQLLTHYVEAVGCLLLAVAVMVPSKSCSVQDLLSRTDLRHVAYVELNRIIVNFLLDVVSLCLYTLYMRIMVQSDHL